MEKHANKNENRAYKKTGTDLRKYYTIFFEAGLIISLLIFIGLTKIHIQPAEKQEVVFQDQEIVEMEEIIQTKQQERVPPPPRPPVPVEVPNDEIIEDFEIEIDAELNFRSDGHLPPPPKQQDEAMDEEEPEEDFFIAVEQMPELIGGMQGLQQKIHYPELAQRAHIEGRVYVQFIVTEKGEVEDPVVLRGIGGGCDEEALRVIREAKFKPGMQRGRPVRVRYSIPLVFIIR